MKTPGRSELVLTTALLALSACITAESASNLPDSGVVCGATNEAGSGSLVGARAFAVRSAFEVRQTRAQGFFNTLSVALYDEPTRCEDVQVLVPDGGVALRLGSVTIDLRVPAPQDFTLGNYPLSGPLDAGTASLQFFRVTADGGVDGGPGYVGVAGKSGNVRLTDLAACAVSGEFSVALDESDGGTSQLDGTFAAGYCPTVRNSP